MLRERVLEDGLDVQADLEEQFKAHLSRGVLLLYRRLKNLEDLVVEAQKKAELQQS